MAIFPSRGQLGPARDVFLRIGRGAHCAKDGLFAGVAPPLQAGAMTQREWVARIRPRLAEVLPDFTVEADRKLRYAREIRDFELPEPGPAFAERRRERRAPSPLICWWAKR